MLKLTVKPGEYVLVGNDIKVVFAGGSANNMRILIDAQEPGNMVHHYKDKDLSKEAKEKIRAIIIDDRKKSGKIYRSGAGALR